MATPVKFVQTPAVALYTGITTTATSMIVAPYPVDLDGVKLTMSDFSTVATCTIDPKVSGVEEIVSFTSIIDNGNNTATIAGLTRDLQSKYPYTGSGTGKLHGSSAIVVFSDNPQLYAQFGILANDNVWTGNNTFQNFPITPATPLATNSVYGFVRLSVAAANPVQPIAVGLNDTVTFAPIAYGVPVGAEVSYPGLTIPAGWLAEDGSAQSRATYANLFAALSKTGTVTVTIASPAVFSATAHGLVLNNPVYFNTTGALPSGLTAGQTYYVISAGLTANAFEVAASPGGTVINTTGSQSGTHTFFYTPYGKGDGSTTFNLPDRRDRTIVGAGSAPTKVATIVSVQTSVVTSSGLSPTNNNEFQTGAPVVFTATVPGNLVNATTYYVVRVTNTTFSLATTLANAQNGTIITLAGTETGFFTLTLTARVVGDTFGEDAHAMSSTELLSHSHTLNSTGSGGTNPAGSTTSIGTSASTNPFGGNAAMNVSQPSVVSNWIIKT